MPSVYNLVHAAKLLAVNNYNFVIVRMADVLTAFN